MATLEELQNKITLLEQQLSVKSSVRVTPHRKLERFSGAVKDAIKTDDWIEDAKSLMSTLPEDEHVAFITSHLEGVARKEVKFADEAERNTSGKIFKILRDNFGEKRSDTQLKTALYERKQLESETVRQFSRGLLEIAAKLEGEADKDKLLTGIFKENLRDDYVRREVKKKVREEPGVKFSALRDLAIELAEDEVGVSQKTTSNEVVASNCNVKDNSGVDLRSLVETLIASQEKLAKQNSELLEQLKDSNGNRNRGRYNSFKRGGSDGCWHCHQGGHVKKNCPKLAGNVRAQGNGAVPPSANH